jgi:hypothetical protein
MNAQQFSHFVPPPDFGQAANARSLAARSESEIARAALCVKVIKLLYHTPADNTRQTNAAGVEMRV